MKNKKLSLFTLIPVISILSGCNSLGSIVEPTFSSQDKVTFVAYAGPTVGSWNGVSKNINTLTDEHYKKIADAGFNKIIALYEGASSETSSLESTIENRAKKAEEHALIALELAKKYNLEYYVRDWSFYGLTQPSGYCYSKGINSQEEVNRIIDKIFTDDNKYIHHSNYAGNFCYDEPTYDELENVSWEVNAYLERMKQLNAEGEPLVNLLPIYASGKEHMGGFSYSQYLDRYIELIGKKIGYISYDFYPFLGGDGSYLRSQYLLNLQLAALKAKVNNIELRSFVQTKGDFTGLRDLTSIADFRFQVYTSLAFGSRNLTYYEYAGDKSAKDGEFALFNYYDGTYNYTYDLASQVNNEVHSFEDVLTSYDFDNVTYFNANELYDNQNFANLVEHVDYFDRVKINSASEDTLLTSFKHKETNDDAFMLMNFTDPYENKVDEVTLKFNNAKGLLMYRFGQKMLVRLPSNGEYKFKLYPGEGRYLIPIK